MLQNTWSTPHGHIRQTIYELIRTHARTQTTRFMAPDTSDDPVLTDRSIVVRDFYHHRH